MPRTLLLADDSVTMQKVVGIVFAHEDIKVTAVANGEDAVARARELLPDIVLADVLMPGKDGYQVCEELKRDPATRHIPVLLLAGTFEPFDEARARAVGSDGHMPKPFESAKLVERVKALVEGRAVAPAAPANVIAAAPAPVATAPVPPAPARPPVPMPPGLAPAGVRPPMPPPSVRPAFTPGPSLTPGPFAAPVAPPAPFAPPPQAARPPVPGAFPPPPPPSIARPPMGTAGLRPPAAPPRPPPSVIVPPGTNPPFARAPVPTPVPMSTVAREPAAPVPEPLVAVAPKAPTVDADPWLAQPPPAASFAAEAVEELEEEITLDEEVPLDIEESAADELLGSPVVDFGDASDVPVVMAAPEPMPEPEAVSLQPADEAPAFEMPGGYFADEEFGAAAAAAPVAELAPAELAPAEVTPAELAPAELTPADPWESSDASPVASFASPSLEISADAIPGAEVIELTPEADETFGSIDSSLATTAVPPPEEELFASDPDLTPGPEAFFAPIPGPADEPAPVVEPEVAELSIAEATVAEVAATEPAPTAEAPVPEAAVATAAPVDGGEAALRAALAAASREVIEKIAWEVVPQLAEVILREHVERLVRSREGREGRE